MRTFIKTNKTEQQKKGHLKSSILVKESTNFRNIFLCAFCFNSFNAF